MYLEGRFLDGADVLLHAVRHVDSDDVGPRAGPPAKRTRPQMGVGVLASVTDQRILTAVRPRALLTLERLDGGGVGPTVGYHATYSWGRDGVG